MKNAIIQMNNTMKMLFSVPIGVVAMVVAKLVHPSWSITNLLIFGLIVFAVTLVIIFIVERVKHKK